MSQVHPSVVVPSAGEATRLHVWARRMFIVGNVTLVLGAIVHSVVHALDLMGPELERAVRGAGTVDVQGVPVEIWDVLQGQSMLYGVVVLALALSNLASLHGRSLPNLGVALAGVGMFACMTVVGLLHLGPLQVFGGPFGMLLFGFTPAVWAYERWLGAPR